MAESAFGIAKDKVKNSLFKNWIGQGYNFEVHLLFSNYFYLWRIFSFKCHSAVVRFILGIYYLTKYLLQISLRIKVLLRFCICSQTILNIEVEKSWAGSLYVGISPKIFCRTLHIFVYNVAQHLFMKRIEWKSLLVSLVWQM